MKITAKYAKAFRWLLNFLIVLIFIPYASILLDINIPEEGEKLPISYIIVSITSLLVSAIINVEPINKKKYKNECVYYIVILYMSLLLAFADMYFLIFTLIAFLLYYLSPTRLSYFNKVIELGDKIAFTMNERLFLGTITRDPYTLKKEIKCDGQTISLDQSDIIIVDIVTHTRSFNNN